MKRIAGVLLLAACGPKIGEDVCSGIALGTEVSTLKDRQSESWLCRGHPFRAAVGPVDDLRCCLRSMAMCTMSCSPPVTSEQIGPTFEPSYRDVSACCVYVQEGKVVARAVVFD